MAADGGAEEVSKTMPGIPGSVATIHMHQDQADTAAMKSKSLGWHQRRAFTMAAPVETTWAQQGAEGTAMRKQPTTIDEAGPGINLTRILSVIRMKSLA